MTWAGKPSSNVSPGSANRPLRSSLPCAIQSVAKTCWFCRTIGPSKRIIASTQGAKRGLIAKAASAQLFEPQ